MPLPDEGFSEIRHSPTAPGPADTAWEASAWPKLHVYSLAVTTSHGVMAYASDTMHSSITEVATGAS